MLVRSPDFFPTVMYPSLSGELHVGLRRDAALGAAFFLNGRFFFPGGGLLGPKLPSGRLANFHWSLVSLSQVGAP